MGTSTEPATHNPLEQTFVKQVLILGAYFILKKSAHTVGKIKDNLENA